ncbi:ribokinase [Anaerolentibacter hominis]|uniref:ribokinase n=1 Tax=Anaerolentibacter hominis TaxID=3079009 RepID=UPI0031B873B3
MKILNLGSVNFDNVYSVDHMVQPGETLSSLQVEVFPGGKGLNQSISLARAGAEVYHACIMGEDGGPLLSVFTENGVDTSLIQTAAVRQGHSVIQVDKNGQNCIILFGGSNTSLTKDYIDQVIGRFEEGDLILLQNEVNLMDYIIDRAYEKGLVIALNPSPYNSAMEACDLSKVTYFLMNEIEGGQITGKTEPAEILDAVLAMYPAARIVLTLGKDGVVYKDKDGYYEQSSFLVKAVDTTAAGDTFTGYFLGAVLKGEDVPTALRRSCKASAIAVTREGAASSIPTFEEVEKAEF